MVLPADPSYYATVAQVIPTLLLAAALEYRYLAPDASDSERPDAAEVKGHMSAYLGVSLLTLLAVVGGVAAVDALYNGVADFALRLTLVGVMSAFALVLLPLVYRAAFTLLTPYPRVLRAVREYVLPTLLLVTGALFLIYRG